MGECRSKSVVFLICKHCGEDNHIDINYKVIRRDSGSTTSVFLKTQLGNTDKVEYQISYLQQQSQWYIPTIFLGKDVSKYPFAISTGVLSRSGRV